MKILVLDGFALNPGDLSWQGIRELGTLVVYDRTEPIRLLNRIGEDVYKRQLRMCGSTRIFPR